MTRVFPPEAKGPQSISRGSPAAKSEIISDLLDRLLVPLGAGDIRINAGRTEDVVVNPALLQVLGQDPAVCALLSGMGAPMAVDSASANLFRLTARGTLLVSSALLKHPSALGVVVRWAQETVYLLRQAGTRDQAARTAVVTGLVHGAALIRRLPDDAKNLLRSLTPNLSWSDGSIAATAAGARWLAESLAVPSFVEDSRADDEIQIERVIGATELALPVEALLERGGDARIVTSPESGTNRYGAASRPRPEAVHFSSSTASSVSDYAFAALDRARRILLLEILFRGLDVVEANQNLAKGVIAELMEFMGLSPDEADAVLAPSGTDTELLAVMIALGAGARLTNILIAPEETGRSVGLAAGGLHFHEGAASDPAPSKGRKVWRSADIDVVTVSIRNAAGHPLPQTDVERAVAAKLEAARDQRKRSLLHVLLGSKTGISAPTRSYVASIGCPSDEVDVVANSCQLRVTAESLGRLVRAGWMVQISGSKFLTGPPFCGALILPTRLRERQHEVARLMAEAPEVIPAGYWSPNWRAAFSATSSRQVSFGPLLRWVGALIEAALFRAVPLDLAKYAFDAFCRELRARLASCRFLVEVDPPHACEGEAKRPVRDFASFAGSSIICFAPRVADGAGGLRRLDLVEAERLFRLLNANIETRLSDLDPLSAALARQPVHIGQPVDLVPGSEWPNVILRLVIGARFSRPSAWPETAPTRRWTLRSPTAFAAWTKRS